MLIAYNPTNQQYLKAIPHTQAECPHCHQKVMSKCGGSQLYQSSEDAKKHNHNIWHWAHESNCIYHTEPETDWHLRWKERAIENKCKIEVCYGERIADAVIKDKVIEFQHSGITSEEIISRSMFYGKVDWIFDYRNKADKMDIYYEDEEKAGVAKLAKAEIDKFLNMYPGFKLSGETLIKMEKITQIATTIMFKLDRRASVIDSLFKLNSPCFGKVYLDITPEGGNLRLFNIFKLADCRWGEGVIIENPEYIFSEDPSLNQPIFDRSYHPPKT